MNRRSFLHRMTMGVAAAVAVAADLDPEKLLWVPGARTIFLPPEKRLVTGEEAVAAFKEVQSKPIAAEHFTHTAAGTVVSDAYWNVISVNGRRVSAAEAAWLRLNHFSRHGGSSQRGSADHQAMTDQVVAQRVLAGWKDPLGVPTSVVNGFKKGSRWVE